MTARRYRGVPAGCPLTANQFQTVKALAGGETYTQIGKRTGRGSGTGRSHIQYASNALGTSNALQCVMVCLREGWLLVGRDGVSAAPGPPAPAPRDGVNTATQQLYLVALDLHLRSRDPDERTAIRRIMLRLVADIREAAAAARRCRAIA